MECPRCNSYHIRKNGKQRGKQNYICADCGRQFIEYHNQKGYSDEIKRECLEMYVNGSGFRAIERVKKVHHTTVIYWVKQIGGQFGDRIIHIVIQQRRELHTQKAQNTESAITQKPTLLPAIAFGTALRAIAYGVA